MTLYARKVPTWVPEAFEIDYVERVRKVRDYEEEEYRRVPVAEEPRDYEQGGHVPNIGERPHPTWKGDA